MSKVTYQDGVTVDEDNPELTLLQISLKHDIPHVHACGGNARCSTCRVMICDGLGNVLPRNAAEQHLADFKGLEPNVRLACQTRISGPVRIRQLVHDAQDVEIAVAEQGGTSGSEKPLAILFSDIREFTPFSAANLPYDVVHVLNRYFLVMGEAVLQNDGYIDKYIGDGMMALFGLTGGDACAVCLAAIRAGLQMLKNLAELNQYLRKHFGVEFGTRIGIHYGEVVIGQMGHPRKMQFTAIGDSVNMASRIEAAVKGTSANLLVSDTVLSAVRELVQVGIVTDTVLKGKLGTYKLHEVLDIHEQPTFFGACLAQRVKQELRQVISRSLAPVFLRLAYHDAITYDPATRTGGANGSVRLTEELTREENRGLAVGVEMLGPVKALFPQVSWADLMALAGAAAVFRTGGPDIDVPLGRKDTDTPAPPGRILDKDLPIDELKLRFRALGFTPRDMVALCGAHTLGHVGGVPFTADLFSFTNSFFHLLMSRQDEAQEHLLPTDRGLMADPECRLYVETFALDQGAFFRAFADAYRKMTLLGPIIRLTLRENAKHYAITMIGRY